MNKYIVDILERSTEKKQEGPIVKKIVDYNLVFFKSKFEVLLHCLPKILPFIWIRIILFLDQSYTDPFKSILTTQVALDCMIT